VLHDAQTAKPGAPVQTHATTRLKTSLTPDKIYNSFAPPETISFWELPGFIALLENAGFAAAPQKLQFHRLLAMPMLLAAMPLLAAAFTLRGHRQGRVTLLVVAGVLTGFVLHVLSNLVFAVGLSSHLPVVLAAWAPAGISFVAGLAALLYLEDG
jgi:lipopolysaccharide export system permease protein